MRRPRFSNSQPRLRAGMTPSVIAEIGARGRVVGLVALRAVARIATALLHDSDVGTGVVIGVIGVIVGPIIIRARRSRRRNWPRVRRRSPHRRQRRGRNCADGSGRHASFRRHSRRCGCRPRFRGRRRPAKPRRNSLPARLGRSLLPLPANPCACRHRSRRTCAPPPPPMRMPPPMPATAADTSAAAARPPRSA